MHVYLVLLEVLVERLVVIVRPQAVQIPRLPSPKPEHVAGDGVA